MKAKIIIGAAILAMTGLGSSAWTVPVTHPASMQIQRDVPQAKTASGKVASVTDNFVTLNTKSDNGDPETLEFSTDADTKVEGKLVVGATVKVEYHTDQSGKNLATRIVVQAEQ